MTQSRFIRHVQRKPRKLARRIPLPGDSDEDGHWYYCWSCGGLCNDIDDPLDDGATKSQIQHHDTTREAAGARAGEPLSAQVFLDTIKTYFVAPQVYSDGTVKLAVNNLETVSTNGCPTDGTTNWRADF
jgi:hypothetical protein